MGESLILSLLDPNDVICLFCVAFVVVSIGLWLKG